MTWKQFLASFIRPTSRQRETKPAYPNNEEELKPYSKNAPGDFYVAANCCLSCGVPELEAPEHFGMDEIQCYVKRQPANEAEVSKMISAMSHQELDCIRYKGSDQQIIAAINAKAGDSFVDG